MTSDNSNVFGEDSEKFEKDISPKFIDHSSFETKKKFLPWHKPRKQLVRIEQWGASVGRLADTLDLGRRDKPLTYLSLPGSDLLDIRALHSIFEHKNLHLQFLGLNSGAHSEPEDELADAALLNQVRSMSHIDARSEIVIDRFEHLAKKGSISYDRVINQRASFDVVNIDLCGTVAEGSPKTKGPTLINAVFKLLSHQATSRTDDWIFFLTTRSNRDMVDKKTMQVLVDSVNTLIANDHKWLSVLLQANVIKSAELTDGIIDIGSLCETSFSNVFSFGIGNWVIKALTGSEPSWRVDMLPQFAYHVSLKDESCDMLSLGFYCKKANIMPAIDSIGLAILETGNSPMPTSVLTQKCQEKAINQVGKSRDIDVSLHRDEKAYAEYLERSVELLVGARYDGDAYRKWADAEKGTITTYLTAMKLV